MSPYLTRHFMSDHQKRRIAEEDAAYLNALGIVAFLIVCIVFGVVLTAAGVL